MKQITQFDIDWTTIAWFMYMLNKLGLASIKEEREAWFQAQVEWNQLRDDRSNKV